MNFCESCNFISEEKNCPVCGSKKLRQVCDDDFCFVADSKLSPCDTLTGMLDESEIPYSSVSYGTGSRLALPVTLYRLYVPYRFLERVKVMLCGIENAETEELRKFLLENIEKLSFPPKKEKKIAKKIKLSAEQDIYSYCENIVKSSQKIVDEGLITVCPKRGHYIFCYSENATLSVNSQTFEILSLKIL